MNTQYTDKDDTYFASARFDVLDRLPNNTKTILDVGAGQGNFLKKVKQKLNCETWGVELEKKAYLKAVENVDKIFLGTVEDNLQNLPDNYFDCITFNDVLEHLIDPSDVLEKIKFKLKKDGVVVASMPNMRFIFSMKKVIWDLVIKKDWIYEDSGIMDRTHLHFYTKKTIVEMFEKSDYEVIDIRGTNTTDNWKLKLLNLLTFNHFEDSSHLQYIVTGKLKNA
jgi:2-polyprenyl-3-methyl-5-hydroxy-6-metoxy-1,4-benzoquinol methylase